MNESKNKSSRPPVGTIGWIDMTTENAGQIRDFYETVIGWNVEPVPVDGHEDFMIKPADDGDPVAGICHKKGPNRDVPAGWMIYIHVDDLGGSLESCRRLGGQKIGEIRDMGSYGKTCVIQDPAGSMCVLIESP